MTRKMIGVKRKRAQNSQVTALQVKRIIRREAEKKVVVVGNVGVPITTAGTVINLSNGIVQGDEFNMRSGDKVTIVHQELKTRFTAVTASQTCRFILLIDRFNQGTTPAVADILSAASYIANYAQLDVVQQKRFVIVRDWTVDCSIAGRDIVSSTKVDGAERTVYYNGSTAVAASNGRGAVFLLAIGSAATGNYDFNWEASYIDM